MGLAHLHLGLDNTVMYKLGVVLLKKMKSVVKDQLCSVFSKMWGDLPYSCSTLPEQLGCDVEHSAFPLIFCSGTVAGC